MMKKNLEDMEFEEALSELEKISSQMNEGRLSLKEAARLYERGVRLKNHCAKILESVELKVNQVSASVAAVTDGEGLSEFTGGTERDVEL